MALRIRKDGRILCAAMHAVEDGDTYIDDGLHYEMSVIHGVIVAEEQELHQFSGEWWWAKNVPEGVKADMWAVKSPNLSQDDINKISLLL